MSSINFSYPWLLLFFIPAIIIAFIPYLKLDKHRRRTGKRITSLVLHSIILFLITLVFADLNFTVENSVKDDNTILLVDVSSSNTNSKEKIDNYIEDILTDYDYNKNVGIVVFGNECKYVSKLSKDAKKVYRDYINYKIDIKQDATNIEEAFYYTQNILKDGGRIILLTDGLQTDGNAIASSSKLISEDIKIDAVYFNNEPLEHEVQINSLVVENVVSIGQEANITVNVESAYNTTAVIKLFKGDELIGEKKSFLRENVTAVSFSHVFNQEGDYVLKAIIEPEKDTYQENNQYFSFVKISDSQKILIIDGTGSESSKLNGLIKDEYDITIVDTTTVTSNKDELAQYNEIILMNCSMNDLPEDFDYIMEDYVLNGGNLYTTGGINTYYYGYFENTKFDDLLPINIIKDDEAPLAIMLVIDASGSMNNSFSGSNKTKMEVAIESAIESVNALRDSDYVGVVAFNNKAEVIVPMTPCSQRESIIQRIGGITNAVGTYYGPAVDEASEELYSFLDADIKHVIFTSDGAPNDASDSARYLDIVNTMFNAGITTSTIAIGDFDDVILKKVSEYGGGQHHSVTSASQLDQIMVSEIDALYGEYLNDEITTPRISQLHPSVTGLNSMPAINGYIGSSSKPTATTVLKVNNDPLYAEWTYSKRGVSGGKVGSFMSDLSGNWSSEYFNDERGIAFIKNSIKNLLVGEKTRSDISVSFKRDNYSSIIEVKTPAVTALGGKVEAEIIYPDNSKKVVELQLSSSNTYTSKIPSFGSDGVYQVSITKTLGNIKTVIFSFTTFSYSLEYDAFFDRNESYKFIEELCKNTKGNIYTVEDKIFSEELLYVTKIISPQVPILIIALLLFVLDIVIRKFSFKKFTDLFKKKD